MKKIKKLALAVSSLFLFQLVGTAVSANAATVTSVTADPVITYEVVGTPAVGASFDIVVKASSVSNLYGSSLDLSFDSKVVKVKDIVAGDTLGTDAQKPVYNVTSNSASMALTMTGDVAGINKSNATLFTIKAEGVASGTCNIKTIKTDDVLGTTGINARLKLSNNVATAINYTVADKAIVIPGNEPELTYLQAGNYNETNAAIKYTGMWTTAYDKGNTGGTMKYASNKGDTVEFAFEGNGFVWYAQTSPARGQANVYIDGEFVATVDQYAPATTAVYQKPVYKNNKLTNGKHTVKIEVLGQKQAASAATHVSIDYIQILEEKIFTAGNYNETNLGFIYNGAWTASYGEGNTGKTMIYASEKGATMEFKFDGTGFNWYAQKSPYRGLAKVYIDGQLVGTVDQYAAQTEYQKLVFSKSGLTKGVHTVKIEVLGEKSAQASGRHVTVDYIGIK